VPFARCSALCDRVNSCAAPHRAPGLRNPHPELPGAKLGNLEVTYMDEFIAPKNVGVTRAGPPPRARSSQVACWPHPPTPRLHPQALSLAIDVRGKRARRPRPAHQAASTRGNAGGSWAPKPCLARERCSQPQLRRTRPRNRRPQSRPGSPCAIVSIRDQVYDQVLMRRSVYSDTSITLQARAGDRMT
jgi:hypothetical protein